MMNTWYRIHNAETLDTPALVIYPERVKSNLSVLRSFAEDLQRVRPHIKTNKCPQVARLMMEAGIGKFKCATISEAEMLAMEGAKDVLLAYQPVGPKARRFCELQQKYPKTTFACLIDNLTTVKKLSVLSREFAHSIRVFADINIGMNRTGISPGADAISLCAEAAETSGIVFVGLHAYDGHLHVADFAERKRKCDEGFRPVEDMREQLSRSLAREIIVVAGGTPTFPVHAKRNGVESSPGTFIFWDNGYHKLLSEQAFEFAALVVTRVISTPDEYTVCVDLGHKSIASENPLQKRVYFLNATGLEPIGHSEEHLVLRSVAKHSYVPGDLFYGVPHHICPTVALYDEACICQDNAVNETWPIVSRKRKISI